MDWFLRRFGGVPFLRGLSVGCGAGELERDVRRKSLCAEVEAFDISEIALTNSRAAAENEGICGIAYFREDFNCLRLAHQRYDIVFFHRAMHRVAALEHCLDEVLCALKPSGWLYIDEYVGPSRTGWSDDVLGEARRVFATIPHTLRRVDMLHFPVEAHDPSEAVRSGEIVAEVTRRFEIVERRDYGGNILALLYPLILWDRMRQPERETLLDSLIDEECKLSAQGVDGYYTVIIARKRTMR